MSSLATRRLIDAAAALDPAERALFSLWVNRGLDDPVLARMTGMSADTLAARRELVIGRLSDELGLPPESVSVALQDIAASAARERANRASDTDSAKSDTEPAPAAAEPQLSGHAPATLPRPDGEAGSEPDGAGPKRRRTLWLGLGLLLVVIVAMLLIALSGRGKATPTPLATSAHGTTTSSPPPTTSPGPSTTPAPTGPTSAPAATYPLATLPGGLARARGTAQTVGNSPNLTLKLSVRGLRAKSRGYHELWLYNSILDSAPLGRLPTGGGTVTFALPRDARRFRWIDISFQPLGTVSHSGESELRATNPAAPTTP